MALGDFAPGYYSMTYDGDDMGLVEGVRRLRRRANAQMITTDKYGLVDGVYKGGECFLAMTFKEWNADIQAALWPFGADIGEMGLNGRLLTGMAKAIVLTAEAGTPAATLGPATITANLAILAPENDVEVILGNEQRDVPVLFQLFPYEGSDEKIRWFSVTEPGGG